MEKFNPALIYFAAISVVTIIFTVADKINAKLSKRRVPEDFLMTLGLLGGAAAEYVTMRLIRHKTLHKKFMIGLPVLITLQIIFISLIFIYTQRG